MAHAGAGGYAGIYFEQAKKTTVNPSKDKQVIIRIWLPKVGGVVSTAARAVKSDKERAEVGHVSIETQGTYASMWPCENATGLFKLYKPDFHTIDRDLEMEHGEPDLTVCLYTLDSDAIVKAFEGVKETEVGWTLLAASDGNSVNKGLSCAALSYRLLKKGGIDHLTPARGSVMSVIVSPDDFAAYVRDAKLKEVKNYPVTTTYPKLPKEYLPEAPTVGASSSYGCCR